MHDFTQILNSIGDKSAHSINQILPLVYEELRRMASQKMVNERSNHTLQATALVHEAYLRLVAESDQPKWENRHHFFVAAAEAMRRILVEHARAKMRQKRGGAVSHVDLTDTHIETIAPSEEILAVDEALECLSKEDLQAARLVNLRYFVGLSMTDISELLGISPRQADRLWAYARSWLQREIKRSLKA
jgi:RNA polymerase sigma factor (TIGR02999 family)